MDFENLNQSSITVTTTKIVSQRTLFGSARSNCLERNPTSGSACRPNL